MVLMEYESPNELYHTTNLWVFTGRNDGCGPSSGYPKGKRDSNLPPNVSDLHDEMMAFDIYCHRLGIKHQPPDDMRVPAAQKRRFGASLALEADSELRRPWEQHGQEGLQRSAFP
jgi:hypothetical protein